MTVTTTDMYQVELQQAVDNLRVARERLNHATAEYVEAAIYEVKACEARVSALLRECKRELVGVSR